MDPIIAVYESTTTVRSTDAEAETINVVEFEEKVSAAIVAALAELGVEATVNVSAKRSDR